MVKLAKAGKTHGESKKMAPPPKEVEEDSEDEEMSEDEDDSSGEEEVVIPQKKGKKATTTPAKKVVVSQTKKAAVPTPAKKAVTPAKVVPTPAKGAKNGKNAKKEDRDEDEDEEDEDEEDEDEEDDEDEEEEEEPVKAAPGKRKKEMTKQKEAPEAKKQKIEGSEPTTPFNLFIGNLNKSVAELKVAISDLFAKNDLAAVDVRTGTNRKFGYVDFESAEDLEKALELTGLKVFGNEIKLEKPKGRDSKKVRAARTLLAKNLSFNITEDELKEVFEDAVEIRLVSQDGRSKGIAYIEFKSEADAEKNLEEKQGAEIDGRSVSLYYTGEKGQRQERTGKNSTWSGESKTLVLSNLSYSATEETLQEVFEKATFIKVPQNPHGKSKGYAFIEFASFEDAKEALNSCNKMEIEGRTIRLELQGPRGSPNARSQPSKTLFVKGLSEDTTEETLKESFEGSVRARIVTDRETGSSKGFGFVDFNSEEDAKTAKEAMEDGEIDGNKVTLDWAKPKGKGGFGGRGGGRGGFGGRGGGRGGRGGFGGRGRGGFGGRGGFRGGRGGGGDFKPQGKKTKFE
uniref:Nucleolin n=1 Tax=Rattus norvegicus TaxID=10116 RepID=C1KE06_RAT|nr:nucleolin-like protein [Rattus norvegicus]